MIEEQEQPESPKASKPYLEALQDSEKAFDEYQRKCDSIDKLYASLKSLSEASGDREFQIFWANLEVLKPTIYTRPPQPVVQPRYRDGKELARKTSEMLERVLEMDVEADDLHETLKEVRDDLALGARGVPWVLDNGQCIHVDREDFRHEPARKWSEVGWCARQSYMTRKAIEDRFPDVDVTRVKFERVTGKEDGLGNDHKSTNKKARVWEIWSRAENAVIWVSDGYPEVFDHQPPLVDVKGFYPCPKPAYGTVERRTLKPVPDFVYYRDQVDEINELTARLSSLAESLRLKGFYASGTSEVGEAIEAAMKATDNKTVLVPVSNFAALGGSALKDAIIWLPLDQLSKVITDIVALRRQLIEDVYEITGLSDIMRGSTEASETATAQNLKAQYGSVRVRERQAEMVRVARDIIRLKAEIYAEQVPAAELALMAQMKFPTQAEVQRAIAEAETQIAQAQQMGEQPPEMPDVSKLVTLEQIDQLLKNDKIRPFVLEIESDSTIAPNEEAEKQSRIEFITAMGSFIQQAGAMVAQQPETAPFAAELMKFTAGGFRAGRDLGGAIDEFAEQVKAKAAQATQNQGPTPQQQELQQYLEEQGQELQKKAEELNSLEHRLNQQAIEQSQDKHMAAMGEIDAKIEKTRAETKKIKSQPVSEHAPSASV